MSLVKTPAEWREHDRRKRVLLNHAARIRREREMAPRVMIQHQDDEQPTTFVYRRYCPFVDSQ